MRKVRGTWCMGAVGDKGRVAIPRAEMHAVAGFAVGARWRTCMRSLSAASKGNEAAGEGEAPLTRGAFPFTSRGRLALRVEEHVAITRQVGRFFP